MEGSDPRDSVKSKEFMWSFTAEWTKACNRLKKTGIDWSKVYLSYPADPKKEPPKRVYKKRTSEGKGNLS